MSLLDDAMETLVILDKQRVADGYGGFNTQWVEGAQFNGAVVFNNSMQSRIGMAQGVTSTYTLTTSKDLVLEYHDVFKRLKDNKVFRVTSDGDDVATPKSSTLNMRQVSCEEFKIE